MKQCNLELPTFLSRPSAALSRALTLMWRVSKTTLDFGESRVKIAQLKRLAR
jgi:hypothetical protein